MAILPNLASTRLPTLAEAATIGNPQGQATQASELARLLGQYQQTQANLERAQELQGAQYIPNSGALGVLSSLASKYMGGRIRRKEGETAAELTQRILAEQARAENEKALAEENKKAAAERAKIAERIAIARRGDPAELAAYGIELPKQPQQEYSLYEGADGPVWIPKPMGGQPQQGQQQDPGALGQDFLPMLENAVMQAESGGDPNAVSPKGAVGTMQTMPGTLRDPGFGVQPARDNSPAEMERVGKDYLRAMLNKYGDPRLALAAYNWGPGNVDQAMQQTGGNPDAVLAIAPAETRNYVPKVLAGAQQPGRPGGIAAIPVAGVRPKPKDSAPRDSFRPATPEEIAKAGLPAGSSAQVNTNTNKLDVIYRPEKPASGGAPTGEERKAATLLKRLDFSLGQLQDAVKENKGAAKPGFLSEVARSMGIEVAANALNSSERQRVESAQLDILDAALTLGTGAAYTKEQLEGYRRSYFPQLGDTDAAVKDKKARLDNIIDAAKIAAGRAAPVGAEAQSGRIRYDAQGDRL